MLAELSWTAAEQTQAIDRVHRIGQAEPVTAWRIIAAHTIDAKIAELIDSKAGLAARALDGSDEDIVSASSVQLDALVSLLRDALAELGGDQRQLEPRVDVGLHRMRKTRVHADEPARTQVQFLAVARHQQVPVERLHEQRERRGVLLQDMPR